MRQKLLVLLFAFVWFPLVTAMIGCVMAKKPETTQEAWLQRVGNELEKNEWEVEGKRFSLDFGKRNYDYRKIAEYICEFEDFSPVPYKDPNGQGFVIGCGINAGRLKHLTYNQSISIMAHAIEKLSNEVFEAYGNVTQNEMTALVSIRYNTPQTKSITKNNHVISLVKNRNHLHLRDYYEDQIQGVERNVGYSLNGLRKRRDSEISLLFNLL